MDAVSLPADVERAICEYTPRRGAVLDGLGEVGLCLVQEAVRACAPGNVHAARVACSYVAAHVSWALSAGWEPSVASVLSAAALRARTVELATSGWTETSATELSSVELAARAVAASGRRTPVLALPSGAAARPYTAVEQGLLVAAAQGVRDRDRLSTLAGLAIGAGAGLAGPAADVVPRDMVLRVGGQLVVPDVGAGVWIPVDPWWAGVLDSAVAEGALGVDDAAGPGASLTTLFTKRGAARVRHAMRRAIGSPTVDPFKLRATWMAGLFAKDLPIDVIAAAAGVTVRVALTHDALVAKRYDAESCRRWLGTDAVVGARTPSWVFDGLPVMPARRERVVRETVGDRLARYAPQDGGGRAVWDGPIGAQVRQVIVSSTGEAPRVS